MSDPPAENRRCTAAASNPRRSLAATCCCTAPTASEPSPSPRSSPRMAGPLHRRRLRHRKDATICRRHATSSSSTWTAAPSQVDTFDYKPLLEKHHGKDPHAIFKVEPTQFDNVGKVMASPWKFKQYGQCGRWVSDLFPHVAQCVDDLAFIRSMWHEVPRTHERQLFPAHRRRGPGPAEHGGVVQLRPGQREPQPARLHRAQRRPDSARRPRQFQQRLPARRVSGLRLPPRQSAGRQHQAERGDAIGSSAASSICCASWTGLGWSASARTTRSSRPSPTTRRPTACRPRCRS